MSMRGTPEECIHEVLQIDRDLLNPMGLKTTLGDNLSNFDLEIII